MPERTQTEVAGVRDLYVGKLLAQPGRLGHRALYADIHLTHHEGEFETVTHEKISQYDEVGISWAVYAVPARWTYEDGVPDDRNCIAAGQVEPSERKVITSSPRLGMPDRQALEQLWLDWHLNGTNAGCAHMPTFEEITERVEAMENPPMTSYGTVDVAGWAIKNIWCPETQPHQNWGSRWWVRPLPAERRERFLAIIEGNQR